MRHVIVASFEKSSRLLCECALICFCDEGGVEGVLSLLQKNMKSGEQLFLGVPNECAFVRQGEKKNLCKLECR